MKRTKRKARYYQYGSDLTTIYNNAMNTSIQAPSNTTGFGNTLNSGFNTSNQANTSSSGVDFSNMFGGDSSGFSPSGALGLAATAIGDIANVVTSFADSDDRLDAKYKNIEQDISNLANTQFKGSNASLAQQSTMLPGWNTLRRGEDIDLDGAWSGMKTEGIQMLKDMGEGAAIGSQLGGDAGGIGAIVGAFMHPVMNAFANIGKRKAVTRKTNQLNRLGRTAEKQMRSNFNYAVANTDTTNDLWRLQNMYNTNYAAFGGLLETNGSNWKTGASYIENGGTHEMNPNDGVQYGIASDGLPNLVEEGEVVIKTRDNAEGRPTYSDYVLSNRVKPTLDEIINANITKKPEKYEGKSWAEIYKDLTKSYDIKEIVNRQDTKDYLDSLHDRISKAQEESRLREQQEQIMKRLKKASPEEKDALLQQAGYPSPLEEAMYACGGKLYQNGGTMKDYQEFQEPLLNSLTSANLEAYLGPKGTRFAGQYAYAPFYDQYEASQQSIEQPKSIGYTYQPSMAEVEANAIANSIKEDQAKQDFYNRWVGTGKNKKGNYWYYTNNPKAKYYTEKPSLAEVDATVADMGYADTYASGGSIHIAPSKKGTFTAAATKHGMGVQEFASRVLANKEDYSPAMVKKANFARNAAHWHQLGGPTYEDYSSPYYGLQVLDTENTEPIVLNVPTQESFLDLVMASQPSQNEGPWNIDEDSPRTKLIKSASRPEGYNYTTAYTNTSTPIEAKKLAKELNTSKPDGGTRRRMDFNNLPGLDKEMLLPITSGLNVLTDALGVTNIADYSNADRFGRAILPPTLIGYNPNGRYVKPLLTDPRYISSKLANQSNAAIAAARDLSGSNRATALANIALNNYLNNQAIGQSLAQTDAANNAAIKDAVRINNEIDRANAQGMLTADQANQSELERYASRYAHQKNLEAQLREQIDNQVSANRSANWNNFLENLQGYFDNQRNRNMANESYGRIDGYTNATDGSGHILFRDKEEKEQFAKDYSIDVRDTSKVKRQVENGKEVFYLRGKKLTRKGE